MLDLPINLFDLLLLGVLVAGIIRGRKRALSYQLIALVKWLTILLGLGVLAAEFVWARRLLDRLKEQGGRIRDSVFPRADHTDRAA